VSFQEFNLHPKIAAGVNALGYVEPTPIQTQAMPAVLEGRDVMGLAQTGTGKTAAFALPILQRLMSGPRGRIRALVISPTRELAEQIHDDFCDLGQQTGLRTATVYGGVGFMPQKSKLNGKCEIVVACPGRLLDHLGRRTIDLRHVEGLVIDEADQLFDMGFLPNVRQILRHLPTQRQTLFFSATMPRDVEALARDVLGDPVRVQVGFCKPADTVSHALYPVKQQLKTPLLVELLKRVDTESVLVFTRTKHRAAKLAQQLGRAGFGATALQGNLSQSKRQSALDEFRRGSVRILVATDLAARGLDVLSISHVINYDIPDTADAYTHRIARTGRASQTGEAYTFVTPDDRTQVRQIERILGAQIKQVRLNGFNYDASGSRDEFARESGRPARQQQRPRVREGQSRSNYTSFGSRTNGPSRKPHPRRGPWRISDAQAL